MVGNDVEAIFAVLGLLLRARQIHWTTANLFKWTQNTVLSYVNFAPRRFRLCLNFKTYQITQISTLMRACKQHREQPHHTG